MKTVIFLLVIFLFGNNVEAQIAAATATVTILHPVGTSEVIAEEPVAAPFVLGLAVPSSNISFQPSQTTAIARFQVVSNSLVYAVCMLSVASGKENEKAASRLAQAEPGTGNGQACEQVVFAAGGRLWQKQNDLSAAIMIPEIIVNFN